MVTDEGSVQLDGVTTADFDTLRSIQDRVLWLAVRMIDEANKSAPGGGKGKVGGHQASCASVVSILTALYFCFLRGGDRVAVKPHASPAYHAVQYLLGRLQADQLRTLRRFGGLQAYPSRNKDPDFQTALPPDKARRLHFSFNLPDATVTRPASFYSLTRGNPASFQAATPPLRALALG